MQRLRVFLPLLYVIRFHFSGKNNHKVGREILSLDVSVGLECPEYNGNRLEPKLRNYLAKVSYLLVKKIEELKSSMYS
jgi:hypothetical protein